MRPLQGQAPLSIAPLLALSALASSLYGCERRPPLAANRQLQTAAVAADAGHESPGSPPPTTRRCPPFERPASVPPDWQEYTGYSCDCRLYLPGPSGSPASPVSWKPCPQPLATTFQCRMMDHFWSRSDQSAKGGLSLTVWPRFSRDTRTGAALLQFGRTTYFGDRDVRYRIVAEADGPVRVALMQANPSNTGCELFAQGVADNRYLFGTWGSSWEGHPEVEGIIAGDIRQPSPDLAMTFPLDAQHESSWALSSRWILRRRGAVTAIPWDQGRSHTVYDPARDPDHLPVRRVAAWQDDVFVEIGTRELGGVMVWRRDRGLAPLLRWYGDRTRKVGNFATDGVHMVWTYEQSRPPGQQNGRPPDRAIMTAPYTTDATTLQRTARRLRSDLGSFAPYPFAVGCGHAGRSVSATGSSWDLLLVRLADGHSWIIRGGEQFVGAKFGFALGFSCSDDGSGVELFATAEVGKEASTIVRLRIDSRSAAQH